MMYNEVLCYMTDLERFLELYKSFGINLEAHRFERNNIPINPYDRNFLNDGIYNVIEMSKSSDIISGYSNFYSIIIFTNDGKFVTQGFLE